MVKGWDCTVYCRKDGRWIIKSSADDGVITVHDTKREAIDAARAMLNHHGGGTLTVKGRDGRIKIKDTVVYLDPKIILSSA